MEAERKRTSLEINNINDYRGWQCICVRPECIKLFTQWTKKGHKKYCGYVTIPGFNKKTTDLAIFKNDYQNALYQHVTGKVRAEAPVEKKGDFWHIIISSRTILEKITLGLLNVMLQQKRTKFDNNLVIRT